MGAGALHARIRERLHPPCTLSDAADVLGAARWLDTASIAKVDAITGEIPVRVPAGGSAFVIRVPSAPGAGPEWGMYLALDRDLGVGQLRDALTSMSADLLVPRTRIVDVSLFPPSLAPPEPG